MYLRYPNPAPWLSSSAPLEAPAVRLKGKPGHNEAELVWKELPQRSRRGFITNYTIFYTSETTTHSASISDMTFFLTVPERLSHSPFFLGLILSEVTLPADATSYTLTSLTGNTKYDTWIVASTVNGSTASFNHSFTTLKYGERKPWSEIYICMYIYVCVYMYIYYFIYILLFN